MELHSIDTLSEGRDDDRRVLLVVVAVMRGWNPTEVIKFATACLEAWGEEVISARLYSIELDTGPMAGRHVIGISCEV